MKGLPVLLVTPNVFAVHVRQL